MADAVRRGDVFLVSLNPARGGEIQKTRPCVIVSPDELNAYLRTLSWLPSQPAAILTPFESRAVSKAERDTS